MIPLCLLSYRLFSCFSLPTTRVAKAPLHPPRGSDDQIGLELAQSPDSNSTTRGALSTFANPFPCRHVHDLVNFIRTTATRCRLSPGPHMLSKFLVTLFDYKMLSTTLQKLSNHNISHLPIHPPLLTQTTTHLFHSPPLSPLI
jgi:hypothetical protein